MGHEKRIVAAFEENEIKRILVIDDVYDMPQPSEDAVGVLLDFLGSADGGEACREAGVNDVDLQTAHDAISNNDIEADEVTDLLSALYARFVATRDPKFDPGSRFDTIKGVTLSVLDPLIDLLRKCGPDVEVQLAGLLDGEERFAQFQPQVVFLDFYLSADAVGEGIKTAVKDKARKASIELLGRLLKSKPMEDPAIVLMSSEGVKDKAQKFRQDVEQLGENVLALRFRFLQKGWVSHEGGELKIDNAAADTLLDTSQGFVFGKVLHRSLKEWKSGAEGALTALLKQIGSLEPKDFAYLFRFRLYNEGEKMGSYLEWLFGENLRALVAENVNWTSDAFQQIDDPALSKGIEGAFDGPSLPIARLFQRVRVHEHKRTDASRYNLGDIFIKEKDSRLLVVISPDCDLIVRPGGSKVQRLLTMDGELRAFDQDNASADQFILHKNKAWSLKWNPKALNTFPLDGPGALATAKGIDFMGTLRPIYAQEVQRLALDDLGRLGLAVAPTMGVDASVKVHLRVKKDKGTDYKLLEIPGADTATLLPERGDARLGHKVLLRRSFVHALIDALRTQSQADLTESDAPKLTDFLREKNEDILINGFLVKGAATKDKGPMGTTIKIASKPDTSKDGAWLQFTLALSDEAMEELLGIDPLMKLQTEDGDEAA